MSNKPHTVYCEQDHQNTLRVTQIYTKKGYKATRMVIGASLKESKEFELKTLSFINWLKSFQIAFNPNVSKIHSTIEALDLVYKLIPQRYRFNDGQPRNLTLPESGCSVNRRVDQSTIEVRLWDCNKLHTKNSTYRKYHVTYTGRLY